MPSLAVLQQVFRELITRERASRAPEPDLVMDDPEKVAAYTRAGREDGVMASVYLYHCAQICEVIRPGDTVVDLACGPATQLAQVARLNPDVRFIGVDLSGPMLQRAQAHISELGLTNVDLRQGDITDLGGFETASVDVVMSTVALHHLPDKTMFARTFREAGRILRPDGGVYIVDFGHLRSEKSIHYFAHQYDDRQPELYTLDYLYSLRAAFSLEDFEQLSEPLRDRATLYRTFLVPFMVALKSKPRRPLEPELKKALKMIYSAMPKYHQVDYRDLKAFFRLGGLRSTFLP